MRSISALLVFPLLAPSLAHAVLPITGNGNTSAPLGSEDPGFAHVGERSSGGLTLIYLGNGWVLTAHHVGETDLELDSIVYPRVPGSSVQLVNDDSSPADLRVYQVVGNPDLPELPILEIASVSPSIGTPVILIGRGFDQNSATTWLQPGPPAVLREGWKFGESGGRIRWGTNRIADPSNLPSVSTDGFVLDFSKPGDPSATEHEAHAVLGDSGGAVFARNGDGEWELAGVLHGTLDFEGQPNMTALDGNLSFAADLARFRDQLIPIVRPACSDETDNDGDGKLDYPADPGCSSAEATSEADGVSSLGGGGLAILATLLGAAAVGRMRGRAEAAVPRSAPMGDRRPRSRPQGERPGRAREGR
jgi:hypothetical protein